MPEFGDPAVACGKGTTLARPHFPLPRSVHVHVHMHMHMHNA
jgi:hypothetical protein